MRLEHIELLHEILKQNLTKNQRELLKEVVMEELETALQYGENGERNNFKTIIKF